MVRPFQKTEDLTEAYVKAKMADPNIIICFDMDISFTNPEIQYLQKGLSRSQIDQAKIDAVKQI